MKTNETKLLTNPSVKKDFLAALSQGVPIRVACNYARISEDTYANYRKRADNDESEYVEFIEEVDRLLAEVQIKLVSEINNGKLIEPAQKDETGKVIVPAVYESDNLWTRKAWILERRFKKDWGREAQNEDRAEEKHIEINVNFAGVEVAQS